MNKGFGLVVLVAAVLLSACGNDGVPYVEDPHHPVDADGKPIKGSDFLMKYCAGKSHNETCAKVATAVSADSTKGKMPKGW